MEKYLLEEFNPLNGFMIFRRISLYGRRRGYIDLKKNYRAMIILSMLRVQLCKLNALKRQPKEKIHGMRRKKS